MSIGGIVALALIGIFLAAVIVNYYIQKKKEEKEEIKPVVTPTQPVQPVKPQTQQPSYGEVEGPSENPDNPTTRETIKEAKSMV